MKGTIIRNGIEYSGGGGGSGTSSNDMTYKPGDIVSINKIPVSGYLTGSSKNLNFFLPLSKPISALSVSLSDCTAELRGISGYINDASGYIDITANYTINAYIRENGVHIEFISNEAVTNCTNNTPISARLNCTLTFA